jgi:diguanylate cyclase (GGDEF)-like protein
MKPKETNKKTIFFLTTADEIRPLYERAFSDGGWNILWFSSLQKLTEACSTVTPLCTIIDLDATDESIESLIEKIRGCGLCGEVIVISGVDSAHLALQCVRAGFTDFLLKPVSPEELAWSVKKTQERHIFLRRLNVSSHTLIYAVHQISAATTPVLVELYTLEHLKHYFKAQTAVWLMPGSNESGENIPVVSCTIPRGANTAEALRLFQRGRGLGTVFSTLNRKTGTRKIYLPVAQGRFGGVLLMGVSFRPSRRKLLMTALIQEQAELSLSNLHKLEGIKQQTFVDDLTGLYNSRYLKFALGNAIARSKKTCESFSILFIDVDYFKNINDTHGHLVGSEFLVAVAKAIKHAVRNIDLVFRYGGDEFIILLHQASVKDAQEIAERLRRHIERRVFVIQDHRIRATITIGLATYPQHTTDRDQILRLADEAMYSAKRASRNTVYLAGN